MARPKCAPDHPLSQLDLFEVLNINLMDELDVGSLDTLQLLDVSANLAKAQITLVLQDAGSVRVDLRRDVMTFVFVNHEQLYYFCEAFVMTLRRSQSSAAYALDDIDLLGALANGSDDPATVLMKGLVQTVAKMLIATADAAVKNDTGKISPENLSLLQAWMDGKPEGYTRHPFTLEQTKGLADGSIPYDFFARTNKLEVSNA